MTKRMERGESLSDKEVPLFVFMLHAFNSRELVNYDELFQAVENRLTAIEARLNTQQAIRQSIEGSRRVPPANLGPPNQNPFQQR